MPAKNSIKNYVPDSYYHLYNRGVEKRDIFVDDQDFRVFLSYLKTYLLPKDYASLNATLASKEASYTQKHDAAKLLRMNNFSSELGLHCYSLLPNHFHLLVKQTLETTIDNFLNSLCSRYSRYFNKRYHRVGKLFQGVYKAVLVNSDEQLLHLSRYIHLNPFRWTSLPVTRFRELNLPSSLEDYLGLRHTQWLNTNQILSYFRKDNPRQSYLNFITEYADPEMVAPLALDYEDEPQE